MSRLHKHGFNFARQYVCSFGQFGNVDAQLNISQKAPEQLSELLEMDIDSPEFQRIKVISSFVVVNSQKLTRLK